MVLVITRWIREYRHRNLLDSDGDASHIHELTTMWRSYFMACVEPRSTASELIVEILGFQCAFPRPPL